MLNSVSELIVYLGLVAAIAERITASIKRVLNFGELISNDHLRLMAIQLLAFVSSLAAAMIYPPTEMVLLKNLPTEAAVITVGLLGSTGSNVWHDLLSTLSAIKTKNEALARE